MKVKVTKEGVLIPSNLLAGIKTVDIRQEGEMLVIVPLERRSLKSLAEILVLLNQHKPQIQAEYYIKMLGIFGSYARGEQTLESDVDILIDYVKTPSLVQIVGLKRHLSQLLDIEVDVVTQKGLKAALKENILSDLIKVWENAH